jgi:general secretion pathway protein N
MTKLRASALIALGIAAYLAFLVAALPASFVAERIRNPGILELSDVSGTIWHGGARALVRLPAGPLIVETLQWSFLPSRLIAGRIAYDVKAGVKGLEAKMQVARGLAGYELRDLEAHGEAGALAAFAPLAAGARPEGPVSLTSDSLTWDGRELRGNARGEWRGATTAFSDVKPVGTYRAELRGEGGPAKVVVTTLDGPLKISGEGTLTAPGRFAFSGEARGEGASAAALEPLLNLMGRKRPDGARSLEWR